MIERTIQMHGDAAFFKAAEIPKNGNLNQYWKR